MSDINRIVVTGRVGKDPEIKSPGDTKLAVFSLAVNEWRGEDKGEEAQWVNVNLWGKRANVADYIEKGMKLTVEGKLRVTSFERDDKDGYVTFVNIDAENVVLPDRGDSDGGGGGRKSRRSRDDADERPARKKGGKKSRGGKKPPF